MANHFVVEEITDDGHRYHIKATDCPDEVARVVVAALRSLDRASRISVTPVTLEV